MFDAATDRLVSRVTSSGTHYYMYDRAGNLVVDSVPGGVVWHYGYDAVDRLVSARRNGVLIARYGYDVLGCRIVKRVYSMQTGADTLYLRMVYSGSDVSFETDSAGTMGLRYTWGPGSDNLLAIEDESGNHYYATTDRLGSIRALAKRDGTWLLTRRWDPYGNEMTRDSSASFTWGSRLRYGWTGREYDVELGMYYHRARYYSQTQRRFIQEDPIEGSTSPYAYVHGSPLEATDPSGMMTAYQGPAFHEFCTIGGTCVNAYGAVTHQESEFAGIGGGGGGSSAGFADLTGFADYAWGLQRFKENGGTNKEYHELTFYLDHGVAQSSPELEATFRDLLYFGRIGVVDDPNDDVFARTCSKAVECPDGTTRLMIRYNRATTGSDGLPRPTTFGNRDFTALVHITYHELFHVQQRRAGVPYIEGTPAADQEERSADCIGARVTGTYTSNLGSRC